MAVSMLYWLGVRRSFPVCVDGGAYAVITPQLTFASILAQPLAMRLTPFVSYPTMFSAYVSIETLSMRTDVDFAGSHLGRTTRRSSAV